MWILGIFFIIIGFRIAKELLEGFSLEPKYLSIPFIVWSFTISLFCFVSYLPFSFFLYALWFCALGIIAPIVIGIIHYIYLWIKSNFNTFKEGGKIIFDTYNRDTFPRSTKELGTITKVMCYKNFSRPLLVIKLESGEEKNVVVGDIIPWNYPTFTVYDKEFLDLYPSFFQFPDGVERLRIIQQQMQYSSPCIPAPRPSDKNNYSITINISK